MDSMFSLMDLIILGSGAYVLYCYYLLKFKGEIKEGLLLPIRQPIPEKWRIKYWYMGLWC